MQYRAGSELPTDRGSAVVHGATYEISAADPSALDRREPVEEASYRRTIVKVHAHGECWVYIDEVLSRAPFASSAHYLQALLAGAREHGLPAEYIADIEREFPAWDACVGTVGLIPANCVCC